MKTYYPIFLNIEGRLAVVIGGGPVALRKARGLAAAGARVRVIAPEFYPGFRELSGKAAPVELVEREYRRGDLAGAVLAFAATDSREVNGDVAVEGKERGLPVCVVNEPEAGSFIAPAIYRQGPLTVAVSTGGASPALARSIRETLEETLRPEFGQLLELAAEYRERALAEIRSEPVRREFLRSLASDRLLEVLRTEGVAAVRETLETFLRTARETTESMGDREEVGTAEEGDKPGPPERGEP